jgi:hypothetical protein
MLYIKAKKRNHHPQRKEKAMKRMMTISGALMVTTTPVLAFGGPEATGTSMWVMLFLGFGALIIVCQMIPGLVLLSSMLKTLFRKTVKETAPLTGR